MSSINIKSIISGLKDKAVENKIKEIQKGNEDLRNDFIQQYRPFIKKVASKVCKRYINDSMDEYSIGLLAFNEAIDQYTDDQGAKFLTFANMVIQRRLIDHIRKEERQNRNIYLERDENEDEDRSEESYAEKKAALDQYDQEKQAEMRMHEIEEYRNMLIDFKISFAVLSKECPKHIDARENAINIAKMVAKSEVFSNYLLERKQLPIKDLLEHVDCSRKTIERNRKYIIAIALIYIGKFTALASYIDYK
ncbi:RNA polymerase sigma-I factor [Lottiidibacillus patelloidae]|uniref:RNA polymerase sigma factor SigI n=1 Tax=Lottiidibacillus patelloidae TaxID=2670334 RepID=A0A263BQJ6_9BACI|nr:RNA polymerase sigma-I factor [Lottiidibacillus patelloidae]OZM55983.1 RNA polymerase sigma-I factor [Lottiidibacillus patelloidae]